jgi:hypothetical protein
VSKNNETIEKLIGENKTHWVDTQAALKLKGKLKEIIG